MTESELVTEAELVTGAELGPTRGSASRPRGERTVTEPWPGAEPMRRPPFMTAIVLTKREAFSVCEAVADAERVLLRCGRAPEAARLAAVFEMVEDRLSTGPEPRPVPPRSAPGRGPAWVRRQVRSARFSASTTWAQPWRTFGVFGVQPVASVNRAFDTRCERASDGATAGEAGHAPRRDDRRLGPDGLGQDLRILLTGDGLVVDDVVGPRWRALGRRRPRRRRRRW